MDREVCAFIAVIIGLCTQQIFRDLLVGGISAFIGMTLVIGYLSGLALWQLVLMLPQIMVVGGTAYVAFQVFDRLLLRTY